jgi:TetR/AcrR family fatty acid metabolism transcriptional regulator
VTKERVQDKRERILSAALKVFADRGFYNAKVSEVAREAGVADGTIYLYFRNKDDLLISLFEDRMDYLITRLVEELERVGGSAVDRIRRMVFMHLSIAHESPDLAEFITVELRQSGKFIKDYENPKFLSYLKVLRDLVEEGQAEGTLLPNIDARATVRAVFGALDEVLLTLTLASRHRSVDIEIAAEQLSNLFLHGMKAQ